MHISGISKRKQIIYLASKGLKFYESRIFAKCLYKKNTLDETNAIFVIKKNICKANKRNKIKRRFKQAIHFYLEVPVICMFIFKKDIDYSWKNICGIVKNFNQWIKNKKDNNFDQKFLFDLK